MAKKCRQLVNLVSDLFLNFQEGGICNSHADNALRVPCIINSCGVLATT